MDDFSYRFDVDGGYHSISAVPKNIYLCCSIYIISDQIWFFFSHSEKSRNAAGKIQSRHRDVKKN